MKILRILACLVFAMPVWAQCSERNAGVAAGGLYDSVPRCDRAILVRTAEDVVRHAVLDAARHIDLFRLGADPPVQMILNEPAAIRPAVESEFPTGVPGQF